MTAMTEGDQESEIKTDALLEKLTTAELPGGAFCIVSADPMRPLTESEAWEIIDKYIAMETILEEDVEMRQFFEERGVSARPKS
jgi:hypothetical protein